VNCDSTSDSSSSDSEDTAPEHDMHAKTDQESSSQSTSEDEELFVETTIVPLRTKNELTPLIPPRPQIIIHANSRLVPIGRVSHVIADTVVVETSQHFHGTVLDSGSVLALENWIVLGEIFETFGPVRQPFYSVRFADVNEIQETGVKEGILVYHIPEKTIPVPVNALCKMKGSDASNIWDEEPADHEMEFSDDEKELKFKHQQKTVYRQRGNEKRNEKRISPQVALSNAQQTSVCEYIPLQRPSTYVDLDAPEDMYTWKG